MMYHVPIEIFDIPHGRPRYNGGHRQDAFCLVGRGGWTTTMTERSALEGEGLPMGRVLPLNSRHLLAAHVKALAEQLGLPTTASGVEMRQLIEGNLEALGHDPRNVQVIVQEGEDGEAAATLFLVDEGGVFCRARAPSPRRAGEGDRPEEEWTEIERLTQQLEEARSQILAVQQEVEVERARADQAEQLRASTNQEEVTRLNQVLKKEKERYRQVWRLSCEQLVDYDAALAAKDAELDSLRQQLQELALSRESGGGKHDPPVVEPTLAGGRLIGVRGVEGGSESQVTPPYTRPQRRGKAPPVEPFTGEDPEMRLEDWLPTLYRASEWNGWTNAELCLQLAGHLRGRALQEWNLLDEKDRSDWVKTTDALCSRLDVGSKVMAAQDFRHTIQREHENVADFVRRLERVFSVAYGKEHMSQETREAFLYGQLQEGLRIDLMRNPSVSGALAYKELCMVARNEEQRLAELRRRKQYQKEEST